jgi:hypothetical protein
MLSVERLDTWGGEHWQVISELVCRNLDNISNNRHKDGRNKFIRPKTSGKLQLKPDYIPTLEG